VYRAPLGTDEKPAELARCATRKEGLTLDCTPGCRFLEWSCGYADWHPCEKIGVSVDAIRFYERSALLQRPPRTPAGYRQYGERDGLLSLRGSRMQPCAAVRRRLEEKLVDVQQKLVELQRLEQELRLALRRCNRESRKRRPHCPILRDPKKKKSERYK
jgi:DNA-binding transcriptional MerR regulator